MKKRLKIHGNSVTMNQMPSKKKTTRPAKIANIHAMAKAAISLGNYIPVEHAEIRLNEREVILPELEFVILNGHRVPSRDEFKKEFNSWNYAIEGKTVDARKLRIIIAMDKLTGLLIITVIDLMK